MMRQIDHAMRKLSFVRLLSGLLFLFALPVLYAQLPSITKPAAPSTSSTQSQANDDPLGRATPHGTVLGFVKACDRGNYDDAAQYLNTRQHGDLADRLAQQLKAVLDQETSIDLSKLSRKPEGSQAISGNPNREQIGTAIGPDNTKVPIYLDRIQKGDEPAIWLFSEETLSQIPDAYESMSTSSALNRHMPAWLQKEFLATPLWRWLMLLIAIPIVLALGSWINKLLSPLLKKATRHFAGEGFIEQASSIRAPVRLLLFGILLLIFGVTSASLLGRAVWHNIGTTVVVIALTWLAMRTVGLISEVSVSRLKRLQSSDQIALAGLIGRLAQIGALIIGALVVLQLRGINLTAVLTGLGIGGLAVAFAAQKTLENLFGGIMLISDRPMRIGDYCKIGTVEGNILDIGLRSTRIRTPARTIVTIPNGQLATMNVENYTLRDKLWMRHVVSLRYDSTAEQIEATLKGIRDLLVRDPDVETSTARVRFIAFGSSSQDIEIYAYILTSDNAQFLAVQERLLLEILSIVETAGAEFSLPTQVTKVESPKS